MESETGPVDPFIYMVSGRVLAVGLCILFLIVLFLWWRVGASAPTPPPKKKEDDED